MAIYRGSGGSGDSSTDVTRDEVAAFTAEAKGYRDEALVSKTDADSSSTTATTEASTATTKATEASASATSSASSATAAAASYDSFDDRYLGAKSSAPSLDNDGDALLVGTIYWDTTTDSLFVWDGSAWDAAAFSAVDSVASFNTRGGSVTLTSADVSAVGALMDSELAGVAAVKATTGTFLIADQTTLDGIAAEVDVTSGKVTLGYSGSAKLETTSLGVTVNGGLNVTGELNCDDYLGDGSGLTLAGNTHVRQWTAAGAVPGINDDMSNGFGVNTTWVDVSTDTAYISVDASTGAAKWKEITAVATPIFFGLKNSADGLSLNCTQGETTNDVSAYDAWIISEGISFSIINNSLEVTM